MATVKELRAQAKARKIPKYYKLSKPQLMSALGVSNQTARPLGDSRARATAKQHGIAKTYAADKLSSKLGGSDEAKRVAIKQRIVKSVSKELKAHEKTLGRKLTIEEKRSVAVKALASEVRAIKSGVPEQSKAKRSKKSRADAYVPSSTQEAIAAEADAAKSPKHDSDPFKRRKGGALAAKGGQLSKVEQPAAKDEKGKKAKGKRSANPHPKGSQAHIDEKHTTTQPDAKSVEAWMQETALRSSRLSSKETRELHKTVHAATLYDQQRQMGVHPDSNPFKKASAKVLAIHDKESWAEAAYAHEQRDKSKPKSTKPKKERIAELHAQYDRAFDEIKKRKTAKLDELHEAVKRGDKDAIVSALNRAKVFSPSGDGQPLKFGYSSRDFDMGGDRDPTDAKEVAHKHLKDVFQKHGGDSKVLGLTLGKDFTVAELKNAYRAASLKSHPDRGGSSEQFRAVNESYERMMPKAKSPALDKVAADTGMTREEVAKAVKRRKAKR